MPIRNGQPVLSLFNQRQPLVDKDGVPTTTMGAPFLRSLYNRGGGTNGIANQVNPPTTTLAASGSTMATAQALAHDWNYITGGSGGVHITPLLKLQPGNDIWVHNNSGSTINVYPPDNTTQIDALGPGTPYSLPSGKIRCFQVLALATQTTNAQYFSYGS